MEVEDMVHKKRIIAGCMAGVLLISAGGVFYKTRAVESTKVEMSQDTVQKGTIRKTIQGTGALAPVDEKEIMIPAGVKIKEVKVKAGDEVKAGDVLATADDNSVMAELLGVKDELKDLQNRLKKADKSKASYYEMMKKKENLEEKQAILEKMKDSGNVTAEMSGVILNVNDGKGKTDTSESSKSTDSQNGSGSVPNVTGRIWPTEARIEPEQPEQSEPVIIDSLPEIKIRKPVTGEKPAAEDEPENSGNPENGGSTETGKNPQGDQGAGENTEKKQNYNIKIKWDPKTEIFQADTVYTAMVEVEAGDGVCFKEGLKPSVPEAKVSDIVYGKDENGRVTRISLRAEFPRTEAAREEEKTADSQPDTGASENGKSSGSSASDNSCPGANSSLPVSKDNVLKPDGTAGRPDASSGSGANVGAEPVSAAVGMSGTASDKTGGSSEQTDDGKETNTELTTLCTIASGEKMAVEIQVDELDILAVAQGQKAEITLNARPDKTYEGVISRINKNGSSQSGTTKYGVQILLPRNETMLFGMNVSAGIFIEEKQDVLVVPAEAVIEKDGKSWICLSVDEKTGEPAQEHEVETGLSDGVQIEITKGAKEGQTVYYEQGTAPDFSDEYMMDEM